MSFLAICVITLRDSYSYHSCFTDEQAEAKKKFLAKCVQLWIQNSHKVCQTPWVCVALTEMLRERRGGVTGISFILGQWSVYSYLYLWSLRSEASHFQLFLFHKVGAEDCLCYGSSGQQMISGFRGVSLESFLDLLTQGF